MNHAVVSVIAAAPAKVRCRTCHSDHDYRHEQAPPPKVDARKAALFNEVLKKVSPDGATAVADAEEVPGVELDGEAEGLGEGEGDAEGAEIAPLEEAPAVVVEAPKPKAKPKAKGKTKK
jgi:hypothetical protein